MLDGGHSVPALVVRVVTLPALAQGLLAAGMYLTHGKLQQALGVLFVVGASGGVLLWTWTHVKLAAMRIPLGTETGRRRWAARELAAATQGAIIYTLVLGFLALAMVYAMAYHALKATTAIGLANNFYFSLTTLATVGMGDFTPYGFGRILTCFEMATGLAYQILAIGGGTAYLLRLERNGTGHE